MYTALYRAYRPETFDEILGQDHIVRILKNQIATDTVSHAYLFCGTRGTGKTTTARILAKGVNCQSPDPYGRPCGKCGPCREIKNGTFLDVIELDAASNNGVDQIRELRESVQYPPSVGRKKVYIIDEVHMLSKGAFNALLKTLEEPPENVIFILATTEPEKLLSTILSRCLRLDFRRVPEAVLIKGMEKICQDRGIQAGPGVFQIIAANADGSVRDGLSILDQCISSGQKQISREDVLDFLGTSGEEVFTELTDHVNFRRTADALLLIDRALADGKDARQFMKDWLAHYRNVLIVKYVRRPEEMMGMSLENIERVKAQSESMDTADITRAIKQLAQTHDEARYSSQPRVLLELCAVKLSSGDAPQEAVQQKAMQQMPVQQSADAHKPAEQQISAQQPQQMQQMQKPDPVQDPDRLWHEIFEDGEAARGSFNLVRTGTRLSEVRDQSFVVECSSAPVSDYAEKNRKLLEDLMEKHTGKRRSMVCIMTGAGISAEKQPEPEITAEEKAEKLESLMGIKVRVDD